MIGYATVDSCLKAICIAAGRPEDTFESEEFVFFGCDIVADRKVVPTAEVPVALAREDDDSDITVIPSSAPSFAEVERMLFIQAVGSSRVGDCNNGYVTVSVV